DTKMDSTTLAPRAPTTASFSASAVEADLRAELIEAVKVEASLRGIPLPAAPAQIAKAGVELDSLVVVAILCVLEPIVGFELPDSVVRAGGYASVQSALENLLPRIEKEWMKRKGSSQ